MYHRISSLIICLLVLILFVCVLPSIAAEDPDVMKAAAKDIYDALSANNLDKLMSCYADDVVYDMVPNPPVMNGKTELEAFFINFLEAFPDAVFTPIRMFTSGNILVCEFTPSGTLAKPWSGILPTGKSATLMALDVMEFENGKVKRVNNYWDIQGLLVQLGLMPIPEMPELKPSFTLPDPVPTGLSPVDAVIEAQTRWNAKDLVGYARMQHVDDVALFVPIGIPLDRAGSAAVHELYFQAISTLQVERIRTIDIGEGWALCECIWKGVHDGPYFGIPATGKPIELRGGMLYRFDEDGLETNINVYFDNITVLKQMGVFPPLPPMPEIPSIPDYL